MDARKISMKIISISLKVIVATILIMVVYKGVTTAYGYGYAIFNDRPMEEEPGTDITVTIDKNTSAKEIGKILEDLGLVENSTVFYIQTKLVENGSKLKAGRYELNTSMTANEIINVMSSDEKTEGEGK